MQPPGIYKIASRNRAFELYEEPAVRSARRVQRIVRSLAAQIAQGGEPGRLRVRKIFENPREIFRLELELPELGYQRITLLDRDALESLLAAEELQGLVRAPAGLD
jgi:hypothetical protein